MYNAISLTRIENRDVKLSWASSIYFIGVSFNSSIKTIFPIPDSLFAAISAFVGVIIISLYYLNFRELLNRKRALVVKSFLTFTFVYLMSAILLVSRGDPLEQMIKGTAFLTFAWWLPSGLFASSVYNKEILYSVWIKSSYFISIFCILSFFFYKPVEGGSTDYNMTSGFQITIPIMLQFIEFLRSKNKYLLLLVLIEILMVLVYANRGSLISILFFFIYKFSFESKSRVRKIISIFFLAFVAFLMLASMEAIAEVALSLLDTIGIRSRTIEMIAAGIATNTSGREDLWDICYKMIEQRPILGWGLGGEYYYIGRMLGSPAEEITASAFNPHNGIIQNFVCFGVLGGLIVSVFVLYPLFHLKKHKNQYIYNLILIFAAAGVIPACISASGFFIRPEVAIFLFLFYTNNSNIFTRKALM